MLDETRLAISLNLLIFLTLDETRLAISLNLLIFLTIREIYCRAKVLDVAPNFTEKDETQPLLSSTLYARLKNPKKI